MSQTLAPQDRRVIWRTHMDERSCPQCQKLNGKIFNANQAPKPVISTHENCRCRVVEYHPKVTRINFQDPKVVGPSYWNTMFTMAYNLPEEVNKNQRLKFRQEIQSLVKSYPCSDCVTDTMNWMKFNKPTGEKREDYVNYLCEMKNMVNAKTNKPLYDCSTLLTTNNMHNSETSCQSCNQTNTEPRNEESESKVNPELGTTPSKERGLVTPDLVSSTTENSHQYGKPNEIESRAKTKQLELISAFKDYKVLSRNIIENLCNSYKIPVPNIIFGTCPDGSKKSCTVGNHSIYLDPNNYSPRTIMHEFTHYAAKLHNRQDIDVNENKVDQIAQMLVKKNFGSQSPRMLTPMLHNVRHDTWFDLTPEISKRGANILSEWQSRFPILNKVLKHDPNSPTQVIINPSTGQPTTGVPTQPGAGGGAGPYQPIQPIEKPEDNENVGVLAMFDGVYQPFANLLGLKARDVNRAHTPTIITSAVTTLAEANVSDLGALIVSLTGALTMLVAGALGKEHIVVGDRVMMAEAGANFMWNGLRYVANPKSLEFVQDDAKDLGEALAVWNTDKAGSILTNDKRDHRKSQQVKKMMERRRGGGEGGNVMYSKSGPNGPTESAFSDMDRMSMGMTGEPMVLMTDGGKPTRVLVGADGKTYVKTMHPKENKGADIKGTIGTARDTNPYQRQGPFTFVGGGGGLGEPDRNIPRSKKRYRTGEYLLDDLEGDFIPEEYEEFYRPRQSFQNVGQI